MAVSALFCITACNDVVMNEALYETGYLGVSLGMDDEVVSKAIVSPSQDMAFRIEVYKGNELVDAIDDHRTVTSQSPLSRHQDSQTDHP